MNNTTPTSLPQTDATLPTQHLIWDATRQTFCLPGDVNDGDAANQQTAPTPTTPNKTPPYLLGPIPLAWIAAAHALGGQCLAIGLLLWHQRKITNEPVVWLPGKLRASFGIPERSYYSAMQRLESAGLVSITRTAGKTLRATINPAPVPSINP